MSRASAEPPRRGFAGGGALLRAANVLSVAIAVAALLAWLVLTRPGYFWPRWVWFGLALVMTSQYAVRRAWRKPPGRRRMFALQAGLTAVYLPMDVTIWALSGGGFFWPMFSLPVVAIALVAHAWWLQRMPPAREQELVDRVDVLSRTRSGALDVQAAELTRIERDLHDGAQARMVSLAMSLGLASELLTQNPAAVAELLSEARSTTLSALQDLRTVMAGIQPPVLADRGLVGAVQALALDLALPISVTATFSGRLAPPVEAAVYFAISECLTNVVKHSHATRAWVTLEHREGTLIVLVGDDGTGGASLDGGTGLPGLVRRLEVFDGSTRVHSPAGGPTEVIMEVRCGLSSPKTLPSSGTV